MAVNANINGAKKANGATAPRVQFPVKIEIGERTFMLHAIDTRQSWKLFGKYEKFLSAMAPAGDDDPVGTSGIDSDELIDFMIAMCELCDEDGVGTVIFDARFEMGDPTPMILMEKVVEALFGPFFDGLSQGDYQPLVVRLASPLVQRMSL